LQEFLSILVFLHDKRYVDRLLDWQKRTEANNLKQKAEEQYKRKMNLLEKREINGI